MNTKGVLDWNKQPIDAQDACRIIPNPTFEVAKTFQKLKEAILAAAAYVTDCWQYCAKGQPQQGSLARQYSCNSFESGNDVVI